MSTQNYQTERMKRDRYAQQQQAAEAAQQQQAVQPQQPQQPAQQQPAQQQAPAQSAKPTDFNANAALSGQTAPAAATQPAGQTTATQFAAQTQQTQAAAPAGSTVPTGTERAASVAQSGYSADMGPILAMLAAQTVDPGQYADPMAQIDARLPQAIDEYRRTGRNPLADIVLKEMKPRRNVPEETRLRQNAKLYALNNVLSLLGRGIAASGGLNPGPIDNQPIYDIQSRLQRLDDLYRQEGYRYDQNRLLDAIRKDQAAAAGRRPRVLNNALTDEDWEQLDRFTRDARSPARWPTKPSKPRSTAARSPSGSRRRPNRPATTGPAKGCSGAA